MAEFWLWLRTCLRSKYVLHLEAEIERLRTDNQRMYDALLVKHGQPPLTPRLTAPAPIRPNGKSLPSQVAMRKSIDSMPAEKAQ